MDNQKTVIFDFDGTLADTIGLVARIYNQNAERFGARQIDIHDLPKYQKLGYKKSMKEAGIRWTVLPKLVFFVSREMKDHMDEVSPYPGVVELVAELQNQGIQIGVLTSNNAGLVQDFFAANNFPNFDFVVSEKTLFGKDKALKKIMKRFKLQRENVVYIGDEPRDVYACHKAQVAVIGVTWGVGGREGLEPSQPSHIVDTAQQLHQQIRHILTA